MSWISNKEAGLGYTYKGAFTKSGDFVGEVIGGNKGENESRGERLKFRVSYF